MATFVITNPVPTESELFEAEMREIKRRSDWISLKQGKRSRFDDGGASRGGGRLNKPNCRRLRLK